MEHRVKHFVRQQSTRHGLYWVFRLHINRSPEPPKVCNLNFEVKWLGEKTVPHLLFRPDVEVSFRIASNNFHCETGQIVLEHRVRVLRETKNQKQNKNE